MKEEEAFTPYELSSTEEQEEILNDIDKGQLKITPTLMSEQKNTLTHTATATPKFLSKEEQSTTKTTKYSSREESEVTT